MVKKYIFLITALVCGNIVFANDSLKINLHGYLEGYYFIEPNKSKNELRESFLYNHNRANAPAINLAVLKVNAQKGFVKSTLAVQTGTYTKDNYTNDQQPFRWINEASISYLFKKKNAQVDIGILPSYIGFETVFGNENLTLSRSLMAENSPYYMCGVKFTFNPTSKLTLGTMISNGWQRIVPLSQNPYPAIGSIVAYKLKKNLFQWNTFFGSEYPSKENRYRFFNNFYWISSLSKKINLISGFDIGIEKSATKQYNFWYSPAVLLQYNVLPKLSIAGRLEGYVDNSGVIVSSALPNNFNVKSYSVNIDYKLFNQLIVRSEFRSLIAEKLIFKNNQNITETFGLSIIGYF